ncbi:Inner membrane transport permease YhhJ [Hartmannibacter diazotrophicus]|uniref:Inner membrane transport permease YhhJ n=1 Tax=Hartmannibacter diazotrophicus TaxID=1482074 RepID=A0A2C9DB99_9HYPH|nr:ABC transporter permease [Hartmannibacter diazotrophicus]SON57450.1 Inner membrane transport permease YhhJ [Hartmannibacter diazotrophicus]
MIRFLRDVFFLGLKEFSSLRYDRVMLFLVVYALSIAVMLVARGVKLEVSNAAIAIVDLDRSQLSERLVDAIPRRYFQEPVTVDASAIDAAVDAGQYTFVIAFPPNFEADVLAGRQPAVAIRADATAIAQAGNGIAYLQQILTNETASYLQRQTVSSLLPVQTAIRFYFNPNLDGVRFNGVMQVINSITILSILLVGAAVMREREHGTMEHLLVMPVSPTAIALAKIWANGLVILVAVFLSVEIVLKIFLSIPIAGSIPLFLAGTFVYLFATTSLGILLATVASSMPQFALLAIPVFISMMLLSGTMTPLESMPQWLQIAMHASPSVYFVQFAQAILYRAAGIAIVWPQLLIMSGIGLVFLVAAVSRFRRMLAQAG